MPPAHYTARDYGKSGDPEGISMDETSRIIGLGRSVTYEHAMGRREPKLRTVKVGKRRLSTREWARDFLAALAEN
jgi:hypothetical protein